MSFIRLMHVITASLLYCFIKIYHNTKMLKKLKQEYCLYLKDTCQTVITKTKLSKLVTGVNHL